MKKWIREDKESETISKDSLRLWEANPGQSGNWNLEPPLKRLTQKMKGSDAGTRTVIRTVHSKRIRDDLFFFCTRFKERLIVLKQ